MIETGPRQPSIKTSYQPPRGLLSSAATTANIIAGERSGEQAVSPAVNSLHHVYTLAGYPRSAVHRSDGFVGHCILATPSLPRLREDRCKQPEGLPSLLFLHLRRVSSWRREVRARAQRWFSASRFESRQRFSTRAVYRIIVHLTACRSWSRTQASSRAASGGR
jgi:hypothetical protein